MEPYNYLEYLKLFKFRYNLSFFLVVIGAYLFHSGPFYALIKPLIFLYISFNLLLYGGLYTLNDILDIESDAKHPQKKHRPLPSKQIPISSAYLFAFVSIALGVIIGHGYFGKKILLMYLLFILINQFYTRVAKRIPYVEIAVNSLTHPMRFFLGVLLVTNYIPYLMLLVIFLLAFGIACGRRIIEKTMPGWQTRKVLRYYQESVLTILQLVAFIAMVATAFLDYPLYGIWYGIIMVIYVVFVLGIYVSRHIVNFYQWLFLN